MFIVFSVTRQLDCTSYPTHTDRNPMSVCTVVTSVTTAGDTVLIRR